MQRVSITRRGVARLQDGHPWIYRSDLVSDPGNSIESGEAVEVAGERGKGLATAYYSRPSQIALRIVAHEVREVDEAFLRGRLEQAIALREGLGLGRFVRLVHGEADLLPG